VTDTEFQVSEPQTITSIHAGDRAAFASALERELDALYRFIARELRYHKALGDIHSDDLQPEDIVDEVAIQALEQARRIPSRSTLKGWLRHLALRSIHKHVNRLRLQSRMEAISLEDQLLSGPKWGVWYQPDAVLTWEDVLPAPVPSAEEALVLNETQEDLEKALNALPSDQRLTFILRAIDGLSYAEIAAILNRPLSAVKDAYRTARDALREHFAGRFKRAEVQPASPSSSVKAEAQRPGPGAG
jgi:RNA polymerase sigma-70 factor (ECF subfamily)